MLHRTELHINEMIKANRHNACESAGTVSDLQNIDYSGKIVQETLTHQQRIGILHLSQTHQMSLRQVSRCCGIPFSTVRQSIFEYNQTGRTNRLLTRSTKVKLLDDRLKDQFAIAERSKRIAKRRQQNLKLLAGSVTSPMKFDVNKKVSKFAKEVKFE